MQSRDATCIKLFSAKRKESKQEKETEQNRRNFVRLTQHLFHINFFRFQVLPVFFSFSDSSIS